MSTQGSVSPAPPERRPPADGLRGMFQDASTLAATGLLVAVLLALVAGILNCFSDPSISELSDRLMALTVTVDVGDVALLGIATALLLLTPDPPGGVSRPLLLQVTSALAAVITILGGVRAGVLLTQTGPIGYRLAGFLATMGVTLAAATVSFYAAKESFLKREGRI